MMDPDSSLLSEKIYMKKYSVICGISLLFEKKNHKTYEQRKKKKESRLIDTDNKWMFDRVESDDGAK